MQQDHVGVLGMHLVERGPDGPMVGDVRPADEGDLRAGRQERFSTAALRRNSIRPLPMWVLVRMRRQYALL